uniref:Uncharacterized protein n=1 Tax=Panagrolaimus davidi TaxID=227884 RepID=A0A914P0Q8_9BILA
MSDGFLVSNNLFGIVNIKTTSSIDICDTSTLLTVKISLTGNKILSGFFSRSEFSPNLDANTPVNRSRPFPSLKYNPTDCPVRGKWQGPAKKFEV